MKRITRVWAGRISVGAALLLFWGVALWRLGAPSLWYDELFNVNLTLGHDLPGMLAVLRTQQPYPPLYYLFLKGWIALVGARPYAPGLEPASGLEFLLRFPSVLAGVGSLALLLPLGRRLRISGAAFLPWLLALHPMFLWYTRDARLYAMWVLFTLAALCALVSQRRSLWWGAATAALLTHYFALFPLAGAAAIAFLTGNLRPASPSRARSRWLMHLITLGAPFLFLLAWMLIALRVTLGFQSFGAGSPPDGMTFLGFAGPDLLTARVFLEPLGYVLNSWWGYGLLGMALLGLMLRAWKAPSRGGMCLGAAGLGAAATFISWQLRSVQHVRYLVWLLPLLALGLAGLVSTLFGRRRAAARWTLAVLSLPVLLWEAQQSLAFMTAARTVWYPDFRDTVRLLNERALPGDGGVAVAAHGAEIFTAYRSPVTFIPGPTIGERLRPEAAARLAGLERGGAGRIWTLLYQDEAVDPGQVLIGTLEAAGGYRVEMGYSRELRLYAYVLPETAIISPLAPPLARQHPLESTFEGGIALRGWSLHREERLLAVYLFWELLEPQTGAWMGAVHLAPDAASAPTVQRDKPVLSDYWMLSELPVGEILPDRYEMVIPPDLPAGVYQLFALLYTPESGQRLPLTTGADRLYLGDFVWQ